MILFERLFAVYYYFFLEIKHFFRRRKLKYLVERDEDHGALATLSMTQFLVFGLLLGLYKNAFSVNIAPTTVYLILFFFVPTIILQYFYFLRNRIRRRVILDQYSKLNSGQKFFWKLLAVVLIVGPIILFPVLFSKHN